MYLRRTARFYLSIAKAQPCALPLRCWRVAVTLLSACTFRKCILNAAHITSIEWVHVLRKDSRALDVCTVCRVRFFSVAKDAASGKLTQGQYYGRKNRKYTAEPEPEYKYQVRLYPKHFERNGTLRSDITAEQIPDMLRKYIEEISAIDPSVWEAEHLHEEGRKGANKSESHKSDNNRESDDDVVEMSSEATRSLASSDEILPRKDRRTDACVEVRFHPSRTGLRQSCFCVTQ